MTYYRKHVFVCTNQKSAGKTCCAQTGGEPFFEYLKKNLKKIGLHGAGEIRVSKSGCLGRCSQGPCMVVYPEGVWFSYQSFSDLDEIIERYLKSGQMVSRLLI